MYDWKNADSRWEAVSYTHLDVYKRQDPTRAFDRVGDQSADAVGEPVSYTHLDVYKRQVHIRRGEQHLYAR